MVVSSIASNIGEVLEVEDDESGVENFRRVRVMLDINKPLRRFQKIKTKSGEVIKVECKYERLPFFCFACGLIGHSERDCCNAQEGDRKVETGWGLWLKASPRKVISKDKEDMGT
ncbi:hypothetical protein RDABS01_024128 [Bienertia sinuspersici]